MSPRGQLISRKISETTSREGGSGSCGTRHRRQNQVHSATFNSASRAFPFPRALAYLLDRALLLGARGRRETHPSPPSPAPPVAVAVSVTCSRPRPPTRNSLEATAGGGPEISPDCLKSPPIAREIRTTPAEPRGDRSGPMAGRTWLRQCHSHAGSDTGRSPTESSRPRMLTPLLAL